MGEAMGAAGPMAWGEGGTKKARRIEKQPGIGYDAAGARMQAAKQPGRKMTRSPLYRDLALAWTVVLCVSVASAQTNAGAPTPAQSATKSDANKVPDWRQAISPPSKPADATKELKELVGIYRNGTEREIILLEQAQALHANFGNIFAGTLESQRNDKWKLRNGREPEVDVTIERDPSGKVVALNLSNGLGRFVRADASSDPKSFYHVTPVKPLETLRAQALAAKPPAEPGPFRETQLVELVMLDANLRLDIRYANANNFLSTPVYSEARAFMQHPAAEALERVAQRLKPMGYGLLIHDAYRPWYVTKIFWDATPVVGHIFVADPQKGSKHNRGCAVDLTMYDLATGAPVEMPGMYDEMSERSFPEFQGGTWLQRWNRDLLRKAMESEGFSVDEHEWWHFDYKDWKKYRILNVKFEDLRNVAR
jgi:D-alanyl-D-alanine dipeptidase